MRRLTFLIVIYVVFITPIFGQDYFITLKINNANIELERNKGNKLTFANKRYKDILYRNEVKAFMKCVQNATKDYLQDLYEIHISNKGDINKLISDLKQISNIYEIRKRRYFKPISCANPYPPVNDTWIKYDWCNNDALELMNSRCAWNISRGDSSVIVGVADTDFENDHEDLKNQYKSISGPISDKHSHGTMVSGMVAAETNNNKGIASIGYNIKMAGYRVYHYVDTLPDGGLSVTGSPYSAIMQAFDDGRRIINISGQELGWI